MSIDADYMYEEYAKDRERFVLSVPDSVPVEALLSKPLERRSFRCNKLNSVLG